MSWLFLSYSVGVNLGFIYLLDTYGKGNVILNPLFQCALHPPKQPCNVL